MPKHATRRSTAWWRGVAPVLVGRYTGLTFVIIVIGMLSNLVHDITLHDSMIDLIFLVLVFFAVRSVGHPFRVVTVILAIPTLISQWELQFGSVSMSRSSEFAFTTCFLAVVTLIILLDVMRNEAVTADTIVGALCVYFLVGVTWGYGYVLLELTSPGSFAVAPALAEVGGWTSAAPPLPLMQYYSFATLTTVGSEISPLSAAARVLTTIESAIGQLYLAVMIARLVGIHTARPRGAGT